MYIHIHIYICMYVCIHICMYTYMYVYMAHKDDMHHPISLHMSYILV